MEAKSGTIRLLRKQVPGFFVTENDFVDRLALVLEWDVVAVDVRGEEDL